jgi:hypothetical protein
MSPLTLYHGQAFGVICLLLCGVFPVRPKSGLDAIGSMTNSPGLLLIAGLFAMAAGVATVIGHNVWFGGALPIAVTVLGWSMPIKGTMLMAVPLDWLGASYRVVRTPERFRLFMAVDFVLSAWLTGIAFSA